MEQMETVNKDVGMYKNFVRFGDLFDYENKSKIKAGEGLAVGEYPFYTSSSVLSKFLDDYTFDKTSLIFGTGGNASIHYCESPFSVSTDCLVVFAKDETICFPKFVFYYLFGNINLLEEGFKGAGLKHISKGFINDLEIPLPPLPIQKRIAEILDAADALKRKDQELLKKYDELAQAIFIDMFGDPVKNEKGWETKKFQELGTLDRGVSKHRPRNASELLGGKYPLIQTGDVANSGGIITKYRSTYSEIGLKQSKMWSKGTLCITIAANIAKTGILDFDACFPDSIVGFKPNDKVSNSVFVKFWIGFLQKILEDNAPESAQKNINLEILRGLDVICPPVELQNKFEKIIEQLNLVKSSNSNFEADNLFQTLIQKAFKGELVK